MNTFHFPFLFFSPDRKCAAAAAVNITDAESSKCAIKTKTMGLETVYKKLIFVEKNNIYCRNGPFKYNPAVLTRLLCLCLGKHVDGNCVLENVGPTSAQTLKKRWYPHVQVGHCSMLGIVHLNCVYSF